MKHSDINNEATNLENDIKNFLSEKMKMEDREIDTNMKVSKLPRENTVRLVFSDVRYKRLIFATRKRIRSEQPSLAEELFINENLTTYNFGILMSLKSERKKRTAAKAPNFDTVYSFEGRVYVKKVKSTDKSSILISSRKSMENFIGQLGNSA